MTALVGSILHFLRTPSTGQRNKQLGAISIWAAITP